MDWFPAKLRFVPVRTMEADRATKRTKKQADFNERESQAREIYQSLKAQRIRLGTQDMRIASIVIAHNGILLTRNRRDFEKIPNLLIEDWTV